MEDRSSQADTAEVAAKAATGAATQAASRAAANVTVRSEQRRGLRQRQRWLTFVILAAAVYLSRSFIAPVMLAAVIAVSLWPLYTRLGKRDGRTPGLAALFTLATAVLFMLPVAIVAIQAAGQSHDLIAWAKAAQRTGVPAPPFLASVPLIGLRIASFWQSHVGTPQAASDLLGGIDATAVLGTTRKVGGEVASLLFFLLITLLTLFGLLTHGKALAYQARTVAYRALGRFGLHFTERLGVAVRATVIGTVLVAIGEGVLIGIGYSVAGVPRPLLFMILTIFVAMLPFGAWFAFGIATLVLLAEGHLLAAGLLFAYAAVVMFVGDNIVQPAVIGSSVRLPFLLALLGTFGGLETFGIVGLFLGPVVMVALLLAWEQWVSGADVPKQAEPT